MMGKPRPKKGVSFLKVVAIFYVKDCLDSKSSRRGTWVLDNHRFNNKITEISSILTPVLENKIKKIKTE